MWYDKDDSKSYIVKDFYSWEDIILQSIIYIKKYNSHVVYIHNLNNFDSVYIFKKVFIKNIK